MRLLLGVSLFGTHRLPLTSAPLTSLAGEAAGEAYSDLTIAVATD